MRKYFAVLMSALLTAVVLFSAPSTQGAKDTRPAPHHKKKHHPVVGPPTKPIVPAPTKKKHIDPPSSKKSGKGFEDKEEKEKGKKTPKQHLGNTGGGSHNLDGGEGGNHMHPSGGGAAKPSIGGGQSPPSITPTDPTNGNTPMPTFTEELVHLGKVFFHSKHLSRNQTQACASCHREEIGFGSDDFVGGDVPGRDGFRLPPRLGYASFYKPGPTHETANLGLVGGFRRSAEIPHLADIPSGNADLTAEERITYPFFNPNEMAMLDEVTGTPDVSGLAERIRKYHGAQYRAVFGQSSLHFAIPDEQIVSRVSRSITLYMESAAFHKFSSKYDKVREGKAQFTELELEGFRLFTGTVNGRPQRCTLQEAGPLHHVP